MEGAEEGGKVRYEQKGHSKLGSSWSVIEHLQSKYSYL